MPGRKLSRSALSKLKYSTWRIHGTKCLVSFIHWIHMRRVCVCVLHSVYWLRLEKKINTQHHIFWVENEKFMFMIFPRSSCSPRCNKSWFFRFLFNFHRIFLLVVVIIKMKRGFFFFFHRILCQVYAMLGRQGATTIL